MLHFLLKGRRKFTALYFDHGTDHGRHARVFVEKRCRELGVLLEVGKLFPKDIDPRKSQEENWRECRYAWLSKYSERGTILMAHHLNDAVETYVMSSLKGHPTTIPYRNERYNIIRPFLTTTRNEILSWAENNGVEWIEDPSNADSAAHDRNFVRHEMMPYIKRISPGIETIVKKMIVQKYEESILIP
jgi:tRNA(Ile)-lysidine synthase